MALPPMRDVPRRQHIKSIIAKHYGTVRHFCYQARLEEKAVSDIMQGWRKPYEREIPIFVKYLDTPAAILFPDIYPETAEKPQEKPTQENINADDLRTERGGA